MRFRQEFRMGAYNLQYMGHNWYNGDRARQIDTLYLRLTETGYSNLTWRLAAVGFQKYLGYG